MENWYVRNTAGKVFGPIDLETLKTWVKEGRVEPLAGISGDLQNWVLAPLMPELEMNWIVENNPGQFYGPTHRAVLDDLKKTGSLSHEARFYVDDRGAADARIHDLEGALAAKGVDVGRCEKALAESQRQVGKRDLALAAAQKTIAQRDERIAALVAAQAQRDGQVEALNKALKQKEGDLVRATEDLNRQAAEAETLRQALAQRDAEIAVLKQQAESREAVHERTWTTEVVEPEVVADELPPPTARQAFGFGRGGVPPSALADLERRAQEELARMSPGAAQQLFRKFRK